MTSGPNISSLAARRERLADHTTARGIDYVSVLPGRDCWILQIHFVPSRVEGKAPVPSGLTPASFDLVSYTDHRLVIRNVRQATENEAVLEVEAVAGPDEFDDLTGKSFTLQLVGVADLDPAFASAGFTLGDPPGDAHTNGVDHSTMPSIPGVAIDYLAKDYESFRQVMLDTMSTVVPDWMERHPADEGVMLVETLAYAADYLSYYQDAVATEAYLSTARQRRSVTRHARLLGYSVNEGCNARTWIHVTASASGVHLKSGTPVHTADTVNGRAVVEPSGSIVRNTQSECTFETMHDVVLSRRQNEIALHHWGLPTYRLETGAVSADLIGHFPELRRGDVLIFEEVLHPQTGRAQDATTLHRHPIRIREIYPSRDPTSGILLSRIHWSAEDALPFDLIVAARSVAGTSVDRISVARGNIVLAQQGARIRDGMRYAVQEQRSGRFYLKLPYDAFDISRGEPYDHEWAVEAAAVSAMRRSPRAALPRIRLVELKIDDVLSVQGLEDRYVWTSRRDLMSSGPDDRHFVVEHDGSDTLLLRFGDGKQGKMPHAGTRFRAELWLGNGPQGNVGADRLIVLGSANHGVPSVRNPIPANGGHAAETIDQVQLNAPNEYKTSLSCVTDEDYAELAKEHPGVRNAVVRRRWTGSWFDLFVYVDRADGLSIDPAFRAELKDFLESRKLAGLSLQIADPVYVPLQVSLTVSLLPGRSAAKVRPVLMSAFSNRDLPDGSRGFFHPDDLTFGQSIHASAIVARARAVPGVDGVAVDKLAAPGKPASGGESGIIRVGDLEILRLDNDPLQPENGEFQLHIVGET